MKIVGVLIALGALCAMLAACSSSPSAPGGPTTEAGPPVVADAQVTDVNGFVCPASQETTGVCPSDVVTTTDPFGETCPSLADSGYCPGDFPVDPNGTMCPSLDSAGYCPGDAPAPAPTMKKQTDTIVFRVSGSGRPSILHGSDSSDHQAPGGYGPLGDGSALPWKASMPYDSGALYYAVTAQLEGGGSITDSVTEVAETWCSDGARKAESFPLANGSASGGYSIARAQYNGLGSDTGERAAGRVRCRLLTSARLRREFRA
jgi:hypothetical protein